MLKKLVMTSVFALGLLTTGQFVSAETMIQRPAKTGIQAVDDFTAKSFDTYVENGKITQAINDVKIKTNAQGKAESVTNGKNEPLTKQVAITKLTDIAVKIKAQESNVNKVKEYQKPAADALKSCPMLQKPKAANAIAKSGEALAKTTGETTKQMALLNQKLEFVKTLK